MGEKDSIALGPVARQHIMMEACDGQSCSPHGGGEAKRKMQGARIPTSL
jgi:hypothetical protein